MRKVICIIILGFGVMALGMAKQPAENPKDKYLVNSEYCERNEDCAIRESVCGDEPMNIYFDNSELIKMQAVVDCADYVQYANPRCEENKCVADIINEGK